MTESKLPNLVDRHVGRRMRWRRRELKLSQEKLGEQLGLTFQQVQKYERGVNRVSAGRLFEASQVMDVPISYFFDGLAELAELADRDLRVRDAIPDAGMEVIEKLDGEGIELLLAFHKISDKKLRRSLLTTIVTAAAAFEHEDDD